MHCGLMGGFMGAEDHSLSDNLRMAMRIPDSAASFRRLFSFLAGESVDSNHLRTWFHKSWHVA